MKKTISMFMAVCALFAAPCFASAQAKPYMSQKQVLMKAGQKYTVKLKNAKSVKWSSSDKKVLTVSSKGVIKAKKSGKAKVTTRYKGKKYRCSVTVSAGKKKTLVVYFSATGTTADAAKKVKKAAAADAVRIMPRKAYSQEDLDYTDDSSRTTYEQEHPSVRPAIATAVRNLKQYDTVYIGYPVWNGKEPRVIRTFLDKYKLKGKTVIPFCTSGGSGISGSMSGIREGADGADVRSGKDLTDMSQSEVTEWIQG